MDKVMNQPAIDMKRPIKEADHARPLRSWSTFTVDKFIEGCSNE